MSVEFEDSPSISKEAQVAVILLLTLVADLLMIFTDARELAVYNPAEYFGGLLVNNALLVFSFVCVRAEVRARNELSNYR
jgi:hypothetical protein